MKREDHLESVIISAGLIMVAVLFTYGTYVFFINSSFLSSAALLGLYSALVILPVLMIIYGRYLKRVVEQTTKLQMQDKTIAAMRAQRHDILNELALALAYLQLGKIQKAMQCIKFIAADLSDKYNQETLPDDAWLEVIRTKQEQALLQGIKFTVHLMASLPTNINEQRLLPKLIANLLDNAFDAALKRPTPTVELEWVERDGKRVLSVKNNGPTISDSERDKIFLPGYSSKPNGEHGWGLPICKKIARELGGELILVRSDLRMTQFDVVLPKLSVVRCSSERAMGGSFRPSLAKDVTFCDRTSNL